MDHRGTGSRGTLPVWGSRRTRLQPAGRSPTPTTHATTDALVGALRELAARAGEFPEPHPVDVPDPRHLRFEQARLPRDAYFGEVEDVPAAEAEGRVAAEMITPYPPGIPAVLPGRTAQSTRAALSADRVGGGHEPPGCHRPVGADFSGAQRIRPGGEGMSADGGPTAQRPPATRADGARGRIRRSPRARVATVRPPHRASV